MHTTIFCRAIPKSVLYLESEGVFAVTEPDVQGSTWSMCSIVICMCTVVCATLSRVVVE